jgi:CheY-like chemotaxis protein
VTAPAACPTILMAEDNPADAFFFREALEACGLAASLHVVTDGLTALQWLQQKGSHTGAPRPDVLVLDLNLPVLSGHEMLARMMCEPELREIPVVVLSTSSMGEAVCDLCPPGHCLYFAKTDDFHQFQEVIRRIVGHALAHPS